MHAGILQKGEGEGEVMSMKYSKAIKKGIAYALAICLTAGTVVSPVFAEEPETVVAQETVEQETSEQGTTEFPICTTFARGTNVRAHSIHRPCF